MKCCTYSACKNASRQCLDQIIGNDCFELKEKEKAPAASHDEVEVIVETLTNADNDATAAPYWLILDPKQNMRRNIDELAGQISGPFFCRKDAQDYLDGRSHHYSKKAAVYCCSGHFSRKYELLCRKLNV